MSLMRNVLRVAVVDKNFEKKKKQDELFKKVFGEIDYKQRAEEAIPDILERLRLQRIARLQNVPTLGLLPMLQGNQALNSGMIGISEMGQMSMPQMGLLQALATQGMNQISQGQTMNPTILKAKG